MKHKKKVIINLDRYGYQHQRAMIWSCIAIKETNTNDGKQKNTKTFHKLNCTQRTTTVNAISKNSKNINHMKNNDKTTVK